jgi:ribonuclease BN (tRNA processing enzyme)
VSTSPGVPPPASSDLAFSLTIVGCSGSFAGPTSAASCYLIQAEDTNGRVWKVLLDLGSGALGPLQSFIPFSEIDAILLSSLELDHCADLCGLYIALRYSPLGENRVPIFGPRRTLTRLKTMYGSGSRPGMDAVYKVTEWSDGVAITVGPLDITPHRVNHPGDAFGLRLQHGNSLLAYTGDTDACPQLLELANNVDLLLAEATFQEGREQERNLHLTGARAGQLASEASVGRLVLTHLPPWTDPSVVLQEAEAYYHGSTEIAKPAFNYVLSPLT